jgi:hypothetical protein
MRCNIMCQVITLPNIPSGQAISLLMTHIMDYTQLHIKQHLWYKLYVITYSPTFSHQTGLHSGGGSVVS